MTQSSAFSDPGGQRAARQADAPNRRRVCARDAAQAAKQPAIIFERRYHATLVDADAYLLELLRYIHLNPVRAGLVDEPGAVSVVESSRTTSARDRKLG